MRTDNIEAVEPQAPLPTEPTAPKLSTRSFPKWGDLLAMLGIFVAVQLATLAIFSALGLSAATPEGFETMDESARRLIEFELGKVVFYWSIISQPLLLLAVIAYRQMRGGIFDPIQLSMRGFDPTILLWGLLIIFSAEVVLEPIMNLLPQSSNPTGRGFYMILSLVVVAPLFEELLCRGVILESVRRKQGALVGALISALIFGVMHFELQSILNAFVIGVLLGYLYLRTRSIFAPIILHSLNNVLAYFMLLFGFANSSISELVPNEFVYTVIYISASVILLVSIYSIVRYLVKLDKKVINADND